MISNDFDPDLLELNLQYAQCNSAIHSAMRSMNTLTAAASSISSLSVDKTVHFNNANKLTSAVSNLLCLDIPATVAPGLETIVSNMMDALKRIWVAVYDFFETVVTKIASWLGISNTKDDAKLSNETKKAQSRVTKKVSKLPEGKERQIGRTVDNLTAKGKSAKTADEKRVVIEEWNELEYEIAKALNKPRFENGISEEEAKNLVVLGTINRYSDLDKIISRNEGLLDEAKARYTALLDTVKAFIKIEDVNDVAAFYQAFDRYLSVESSTFLNVKQSVPLSNIYFFRRGEEVINPATPAETVVGYPILLASTKSYNKKAVEIETISYQEYRRANKEASAIFDTNKKIGGEALSVLRDCTDLLSTIPAVGTNSSASRHALIIEAIKTGVVPKDTPSGVAPKLPSLAIKESRFIAGYLDWLSVARTAILIYPWDIQ